MISVVIMVQATLASRCLKQVAGPAGPDFLLDDLLIGSELLQPAVVAAQTSKQVLSATA